MSHDDEDGHSSGDEYVQPFAVGHAASNLDLEEVHPNENTDEMHEHTKRVTVKRQSIPEVQIETNHAQGLVWHAQIVADDVSDPKFCTAVGKIKPRRGLPHICIGNLMAGLAKHEGTWFFNGKLNGWGALQELRLQSITRLVSEVGRATIHRVWTCGDEEHSPNDVLKIAQKKTPRSLRATFWAPSWSLRGWSKSAGYVMWFFYHHEIGKRFAHGEDILSKINEYSTAKTATAEKVHLFVHRYAKETESIKDTLTWHEAIIIEWSHGQFVTVVELGFRNGVGGYAGRVSWYEDFRSADRTQVFAEMPECVKAPWDTKTAELRAWDFPGGMDRFREYVTQFSDKGSRPLEEQRYFAPCFTHSASVALSSRTCADVARGLINYILRYDNYFETSRNCQTFACDFYSYLTGDTSPVPYQTVLVPFYKPRVLNFFYDADRIHAPKVEAF